MSWSGLLRSLNTSLSYGKWGAWAAETKLDKGYLLWDLCALTAAPRESGLDTRCALAELGLQ